MTYDEIKERLDNADVLPAIVDSKDFEQLVDCLKHPGLVHLWSLMLAARQGQFMMLSAAPTGNTAEIQRLGVIQGTIKGIELFRETVLEQFVSSDTTQGAE